MTAFFSSLLMCSLTGSTAYLLLKLLLLLEDRRLSQRWRCCAGTAAALLFLLPLYRLWHLLPKAPSVLLPAGVSVTSTAAVGSRWAGVLEGGAVLWAVAAGGVLLWDLACLLRFRRRVSQAKPLPDGALTALAQAEALGYPLFVKPLRAGSSYGVARVETPRELLPAVAEALRYDSRVLVEEAVLYGKLLPRFSENPQSRAKAVFYAIVANGLSCFLGLRLAQWIPGLF